MLFIIPVLLCLRLLNAVNRFSVTFNSKINCKLITTFNNLDLYSSDCNSFSSLFHCRNLHGRAYAYMSSEVNSLLNIVYAYYSIQCNHPPSKLSTKPSSADLLPPLFGLCSNSTQIFLLTSLDKVFHTMQRW